MIKAVKDEEVTPINEFEIWYADGLYESILPNDIIWDNKDYILYQHNLWERK